MVANRKNSDQNPKNSQTQNFQNLKNQKSKIENFQNLEDFFFSRFFFSMTIFFSWDFFSDDEKKSWEKKLLRFFSQILKKFGFWKFWDFENFEIFRNFSILDFFSTLSSNKKIYTKYFDFGFFAKNRSSPERSEKTYADRIPNLTRSEHSVRS